MQIGMVGLGRMGRNMAIRLLKDGHDVVVFNRTKEKVLQMQKEGATGADCLDDMVKKLEPPRVVWVMLPAGDPVREHVKKLSELLSDGDILIDGGNSYYGDDIVHRDLLGRRGLHYIDAGVSGGIWGLENGYCLMIGGEKKIFEYIEPILKSLSVKDGYMYCGDSGAGHFVKMVHNGIEYGMMEAYGEGFEIIRSSPYSDGISFEMLSRLWNRGSVVRSWLLELLEDAFRKDPELTAIKGYVEDSGEGRWTVQQAIETGTPVPVIAMSLFRRFESRIGDSFSNRVLAALRNEFGGHRVVSTQGKEGHEKK